MRDFRVVPASTGLVVQCACGWYAPLWDREPVDLWEEHDRDGCYVEPKPTTDEGSSE